MTKLRNGDGRLSDGHEYDENGVPYLSVVPCAQHRADAYRNRAQHGTRDVPRRRKRHA